MSDNQENEGMTQAERDMAKISPWLDMGESENAKKMNWENTSKDWTNSLRPHLKILSASSASPHPSVTFSFTVQQEHCNVANNLHGGAAATLLDWCTTFPIMLVSRPDFWNYFGVSRTLNTTYLRPVLVGTEVIIECEILHIGRRLCATRGVIRNKSDGAILVICEHNKANTDPEVSSRA